MTEQQKSELFVPFSQASQKTAKRFGGTGLGLSISKRLAEGMGGHIAVQSEHGKGSCFTLVLPVSKSQAKNLVTVRHDAETKPLAGKESKRLPSFDARILLADDRRDVWRVGKYFLDKCGARVTVVEDGQQAVDEITKAEADGDPFELILMDMQMPVMNGREAVAKLRDDGFTMPIIALTADAMDGERESCLDIGCDEYFPKPIHGVKLMNLVASLLETHKRVQ